MPAPEKVDVVDKNEIPADAEDFEQIPWSLSYVAVCIMLPLMAGGINGFAWSGYSLYVRSMGWNFSMAGLAVSIGSAVRMITQQVIFRAGIWTCAIFAALQAVIAVLGIIYTEEAAIVYTQAGAIIALDVTIAIEGITFDNWSDSEVMVGQAQSTVLSMCTIAYALAATLGGVIYDAAGWKGMSVFHTVCSVGQCLVVVLQPALRESFRAFIYGHPQDEDEVTVIKVVALESNRVSRVSIVPVASTMAIKREVSPVLPGAVEWDVEDVEEAEADAAMSMSAKATTSLVAAQATTSIVVADVEGVDAASTAARVRPFVPTVSERKMASQKSSVSMRSSRRSSRSSRASKESSRSSHRNLISANLARSSLLSPEVRRSEASSVRNSQVTQKSSTSSRTNRSNRTNGTGQSNQSKNTVQTVISIFSSLSRPSEAGENFQYNYSIQNSLRPHIASKSAEMSLQSDDEEEDNGPNEKLPHSKAESRPKRTMVKDPGLTRDMYCVAFMLALCSFCNNGSYSIEWATYAVFFKDQHGWTSATWAGICQTAGDLIAAVMIRTQKAVERPDLDELEGCRWYLHAMIAQPHNLVFFMFSWALLSAGLCMPWLPAAVASQVLMGTLYVYAVKAATDMNLFYSLGSNKVFLQLQVQCRNADAIGALISGYFAYTLYDFNPLAPYLLTCGLSLVIAIIVMVGFCHRVGFGQDIETAEAQRSRTKGLQRQSLWKSTKSGASSRALEEKDKLIRKGLEPLDVP